MAILLNRENVICEVDRIVVRDDGEATGGSEPYLWSIFFKIDGDGVAANIQIDDHGVSMSLDGVAMVTSPDEGSHENLSLDDNTVSVGGLGERETSVVVDVPAAVGRFRTELVPIPTTIEIDPDSWIADAIDNVLISIEEITASLSGGGCPQSGGVSQLLGQFATEFLTDVVGGIPGAFGALYLLMEEDWTDEETAEEARVALWDAFEGELNDTVIPSISLRNQEVGDATMEEIESRVSEAVTQAVVAGISYWWLLLGVFGILIIADQDDPLGSAVPMMSHFAIAKGEEQDIDEDLRPPDQGRWSLRGRIGRDS